MQTCQNKQNEGGQHGLVIRRMPDNRRNNAYFIFLSFIRHSCRPSFHDTSTSGTREIICMSLKRCHDLTYRAEKLSLSRVWGEKRSHSHLTPLAILLSSVPGRVSGGGRRLRRKSLEGAHLNWDCAVQADYLFCAIHWYHPIPTLYQTQPPPVVTNFSLHLLVHSKYTTSSSEA